MRPTKHDEMGIVGVILTIVIVFALVAVVELTRTLEAAQQIDTRVIDITSSVSGANTHLNTGCLPAQPTTCNAMALPVLSQTVDIVKQIDTAAKPLTGQAGQILTDVNSINTSVSSILTTAQSINGTAKSIGGLAASIGASVNTIHSNLSAVNTDVVAIKGTATPDLALGVNDIDQRVDIVLGLISPVNGIKADTATITAQAGAILVQAQHICNDTVTVLATLPLTRICS
jgi:methyl-accepting chemotaxis protein